MHLGTSVAGSSARTGPGCWPPWPTAPSLTSTSSSSRPACARVTSWPATRAWPSASAAASWSTTGAAPAIPDVYAIGECACIGGRVYGLVAPGYAMAEVLADRLTGGTASFTAADTSTKLKLLGVDVASFGDALAATEARSR